MHQLDRRSSEGREVGLRDQNQGVKGNGNGKGLPCEPSLLPLPPPPKSNLKRPSAAQEQQQLRKVNWPDAHGKDLAHVLEFHSSVMEEGELKGVRNSCTCAIQ